MCGARISTQDCFMKHGTDYTRRGPIGPPPPQAAGTRPVEKKRPEGEEGRKKLAQAWLAIVVFDENYTRLPPPRAARPRANTFHTERDAPVSAALRAAPSSESPSLASLFFSSGLIFRAARRQPGGGQEQGCSAAMAGHASLIHSDAATLLSARRGGGGG